jgi:hypothetical protein
VVTEVAADHLPRSEQIPPIGARNVDRRLHDVLEASACGAQGDPKVCHHLLGLAGNVSDCHRLARLAEGARSGREDEPRAVTGNCGIGIRSARRESRGAYEFHLRLIRQSASLSQATPTVASSLTRGGREPDALLQAAVIRQYKRSESPAPAHRIAGCVLVEAELLCSQGQERTELRRRTERVCERLAAGKRDRSPEPTVDLRDDPGTVRLHSSGELRQLVERNVVVGCSEAQPDHCAGVQARRPRVAFLVHRRPQQLSRPNAIQTANAITDLGCSSDVDKGNSSYC